MSPVVPEVHELLQEPVDFFLQRGLQGATRAVASQLFQQILWIGLFDLQPGCDTFVYERLLRSVIPSW